IGVQDGDGVLVGGDQGIEQAVRAHRGGGQAQGGGCAGHGAGRFQEITTRNIAFHRNVLLIQWMGIWLAQGALAPPYLYHNNNTKAVLKQDPNCQKSAFCADECKYLGQYRQKYRKILLSVSQKRPALGGTHFCAQPRGRNSFPLISPWGQNLALNRALAAKRLAHSQRQISLYVSRPSAHVGWAGLFDSLNYRRVLRGGFWFWDGGGVRHWRRRPRSRSCPG